MSKLKRYYVVPCDNQGTLTDSEGNPPPRDRTWDVMDRVTGSSVFINCYTRKEARAEAARRNAENDSTGIRNGDIGVSPE